MEAEVSKEAALILLAIIGWWLDKQYDRYIEDLIEDGENEERNRVIRFRMYNENSDAKQHVEKMEEDFSALLKDGKKEEAQKLNEKIMTWVAPIRITKKEAREKFKLKVYLCNYVLLGIPAKMMEWLRRKNV